MPSSPPKEPEKSVSAGGHSTRGAPGEDAAPFSRTQAMVLLVLIAALGLGLFLARHRGRLSAEPILTKGDASTYALRVNVNEAGWEELALLPGIGRQKAEGIVAHREANGPFACPEDLEEVDGIGPGIREAVAAYIVFGE